MSTSIAERAEMLQKRLIEDANCIGRESGFIQRQRAFGSPFHATACREARVKAVAG
jgi:hypothetical protein